MAKVATRRGVKRRATSPPDRALLSNAAEGDSRLSPDTEGLIPHPTNLMSLPNETLLSILRDLGEQDLWALSLANRRLARLASEILHRQLYNNPTRCKQVLLWTVEVGRHDLLRNMLDREVNPNFFYISSLLRSRLQDVLAAQGRRGTPQPHRDRALAIEELREHYSRSARVRSIIHAARETYHRRVPMEQDADWNMQFVYTSICPLNVFAITANSGASPHDTRNYWAWTPLHVAVQRGDLTATRLLLEHGADVDAQCSGLCDCAAPDLDGQDDATESIMPNRRRSTWTTLHVAMCCGHEKIAKLLLSKDPSMYVGSAIYHPGNLLRKSRLSITALQNAAWMGSVQMCKMLLALPVYNSVSRRNRRDQTALHYAAAGGHIRTVGRILLKHGAKIQDRHDSKPESDVGLPLHLSNDPLRLLCMQGRYDDARWLLQNWQQLNPEALTDPGYMYTKSLAVLCFLQPPAAYCRLSLREQQDRMYRLSPHDLSYHARDTSMAQEIRWSGSKRVSLAKKLLDLGANPNWGQVTESEKMPINSMSYPPQQWRTPLQLATSCGFTEMVKLLLSRGADGDKTSDNGGNLLQLPVMLATKQALSPGGDYETVKAILDAGASLEDRGGRAILVTLLSLKPRRNPCRERSGDWPDWQKWLDILEMFLEHGAAEQTSPENWAGIFTLCSEPGNLQLCQMLYQARSTSNFQASTFRNMLVNATTSCWPSPGPGGSNHDFTQDPELIRWMFDRCLDARGRLKVPIIFLEKMIQQAYSQKMFKVVEALRECLARLKKSGN